MFDEYILCIRLNWERLYATSISSNNVHFGEFSIDWLEIVDDSFSIGSLMERLRKTRQRCSLHPHQTNEHYFKSPFGFHWGNRWVITMSYENPLLINRPFTVFSHNKESNTNMNNDESINTKIPTLSLNSALSDRNLIPSYRAFHSMFQHIFAVHHNLIIY